MSQQPITIEDIYALFRVSQEGFQEELRISREEYDRRSADADHRAAEADRRFAESKAQSDRSLEQLKRSVAEATRAVNALTTRWGRFVEELVEPAVVRLFQERGIDVKEKQSGTSVKAKPKISKKGNRNLRKAVHLPALTAVKWNENFKNIYARLVSKHGIKMKALVAIQRKLLELIYILFKNNTVYDKDYEVKNSVQTQVA